jgi:exonuclease SbcC
VRDATRADHVAHEAAQGRLGEVHQRISRRDDLRQRHAAAAQALARAESDLQHTRERYAAAQQAERRLAELAPALARQMELERAREAVQRDAQRVAELQRSLHKAERERERLEREVATGERRIAELEASRPLAELLEERRERVAELQSRRVQGTEQKKRLEQVRTELSKLAPTREKAAHNEAKARENVRKIVDQQPAAEQLPALEARHADIEGELRRLEARQEHHRLSREQSSGGACPFLREPCLNIQRRGTNSLVTYFDRLLASDEEALAPLRAELAGVVPQLDHARRVKSYCDQLDHYQQQHQQAAEHLAELDDRLAALRRDQTTIEQWLAAACPDERGLAEAQSQFKASDDADKRLREIAPLQAQVMRAREQLAEIAAETVASEAELAALAGIDDALRAVTEELDALGDPRHEVAALEGMARERAPLEADVAAHERVVVGARKRLAEIDEALRPFATIDAEQQAIEDELERTRPGHTRYLQFEQVAARLAEREAAVTAATRESRDAEAAHRRVAAAHSQARASFDADELARIMAEAARLVEERGSMTERLRSAQQESKTLAAEIARVEGLLDDLRAARDELETLVDLERMLQQFRDTIKEAGPNIMKALLRQISTEANRIFGEILGDRSAQLSWENDYEIVLRRDGNERTFAQLSGGEQMSAALAVRLALLRGLTRLDIAFFDEPTQNMDGERRGNLAEQIRRVRGFDQLVVISHDDTFEQGLDNVIHLEKRGGETLYIEEGALVSA